MFAKRANADGQKPGRKRNFLDPKAGQMPGRRCPMEPIAQRLGGAGAMRPIIVCVGRGGLYASYCRLFVGGVAWTSSRLLSHWPASLAVTMAAYLNDVGAHRLATRYDGCNTSLRTARMPPLCSLLFPHSGMVPHDDSRFWEYPAQALTPPTSQRLATPLDTPGR